MVVKSGVKEELMVHMDNDLMDQDDRDDQVEVNQVNDDMCYKQEQFFVFQP